MDKIKNLTIRKSIVLYMAACLLISFFAGAVVMKAATHLQNYIWSKYMNEDEINTFIEINDKGYTAEIPRASRYEMSPLDDSVSEICDFFETYSILLCSILGTIFTVFLFYKNKIREPLYELTTASKAIAQNNLNFQIKYHNGDEFGRLCEQFERMRQQLEDNNRHMWKMIEEEKTLRAAVIHDISSPLAVMKGYQEMLLDLVSKEHADGISAGDKQEMQEMQEEGMNQMERLNRFIRAMRKVSSLEERKVEYETVSMTALTKEIETNLKIAEKREGKQSVLRRTVEEALLTVDSNMVLEVINNLLMNAFRYAKQQVTVDIKISGLELEVAVMDDGPGFSESADQVTKAYYHSNPQDELEHFGLGMYISRMYCEKHGGRLLVSNGIHGGGEVKAIFKMEKQNKQR